MTALVLAGARLTDGTTADVLIDDGKIAHVGPPGTAGLAAQVLDLEGYLLLPAPAEPHSHLDKALTAGFLDNPAGDLDGAVAAWYRYRATVRHEDVVEQGVAAVLRMVGHGVTAVRTHVDVGTTIGLRLLNAVAEVRDRLRDRIEIGIVAFVDIPASGRLGADNRAVLQHALTAGADVVGGAPYRDPSPALCQDELLTVAAHHGVPVDLHTDESTTRSVHYLERLATEVRLTGFPHQVTASHCVSLGMQSDDCARGIAAKVAAAGIAVVCCPATNLYLQGRGHPQPVPRGLTALHALMKAGVIVAGGGDNLQDPFNPLGNGDPLDTARLLVIAGHSTVDQAYDAVSTHARRVMGLPEVRVAPGYPAELLAVPARSLREAMAERDPRRIVIHAGNPVSGAVVPA